MHDELGSAVLAQPPVLAALAAALHFYQRAVSLHVVAFRPLARAATTDALVIMEEVAAAVTLAMQHLPGNVLRHKAACQFIQACTHDPRAMAYVLTHAPMEVIVAAMRTLRKYVPMQVSHQLQGASHNYTLQTMRRPESSS